MSYSSDYFNAINKKKKKDEEEIEQKSSNTSYSSQYFDTLRSGGLPSIADLSPFTTDIGPVKDTKEEEKKEKWYEGWLTKGAFDDGYQFGDVIKTVGATASDLKTNLGAGILEMGEGLMDSLAYLGGASVKAVGLRGSDTLSEGIKDFIKKDTVDGEKIANFLLSPENKILEEMGEDYDDLSLLGEKTDSLVQSAGQLAGTIGLQAVGVPWFLTTGVTSFGGGVEEAFNEGASYTEAGLSAAITAGADILTEKLFGGSGLGEKGLINLDGLTKGISKKAVKALVDFGIDVTAEGFEEVGAGILSNLGTALYKEDNLKDILLSEEAVDEYIQGFIGGAVLGGGMNSVKVGKSIKQGTDYRTGLTANEQKVFDKTYNDAIAEAKESGKKLSKNDKAKIHDNIMNNLQKGYISTDSIEEVLGGQSFDEYKSITEQEKTLTDEISQLENMPDSQITVKQKERLLEAREELKNLTGKDELKTKLTDGVKSQIDAEAKKLTDRGSYLAESYNEIERKRQAFTADLTKYKGKQKDAIERAIKSGVLNNTNRSHELVDTLSKIEADKGIVFDFTDNAKLKESGFAVEGKAVNGFVKNGSVTLNVQSSKAWQSTVGHEVTHVLEGTTAYGELQKALFAYAESKGELESRRTALTELYKGIDADIDAELTADLVGDYLFSDSDFIKGLTTNKTVFQKVYDEVKYLCKVATGKEKADIEKVKREFDKIWKEFAAEDVSKEADGKVNYSISETTDGNLVAVVDNDILKNIDTTSWDDTKKETAKKAASDALKQFSDGIVVDGITRKVNRTSRREYTRSAYTENLYKNAPDMFADKMRAADIADDIVVATTNWNRDGSLKHSRDDNFVDFDHGTTLIMSGDAKYKAEVVVGITKNGEAVLYDVVDMTPTTFETKKAETSTTATTQYAIGDIQEISAEGIVTENGNDVKTQFSLSKSVEETKNLIAVHGTREGKLLNALKLEGLPGLSTAVINIDDGLANEDYGEISLVFDKHTIDPTLKGNAVYGADIWSPTQSNAQVERQTSSKGIRQFESKITDLAKNVVGGAFTGNVNLDGILYTGSDATTLTIEDLSYRFDRNDTVMAAYLASQGKDIEPIMKPKMYHSRFDNETLAYVLSKFQDDEYSPLSDEMLDIYIHSHNYEMTEAETQKMASIFKELMLKRGMREDLAEKLVKNRYEKDNNEETYKLLDAALRYDQDGRPNEETIDRLATSNAMEEIVSKDWDSYRKWIAEQITDAGVFTGEEGLYNKTDRITNSGRKTFKQSHIPITAANIVKLMNKEENRGVGYYGFGVEGIQSLTATKYSSIDSIKADKGRLKKLDSDEYNAIISTYNQKLNNLVKEIAEYSDVRLDTVSEAFKDAAKGARTTSSIKKAYSFYDIEISDELIKESQKLYNEVGQIPSKYFEAKASRVVGFNEIRKAVIPDNSSKELVDALEEKGIPFVIYESGNKQARLDILNSLEDVKFSLSNKGEQFAPVGTPLNELYLGPTKEDIASMENATVEDMPIAPPIIDDAPMPTDADVPPEVEYYNLPDTTAIDDKALKNIGKSLRDTLFLTAQETKAIQEIVQEYSTSENPNKDNLFYTIKEKFGEKVWKEKNQELAEVKRFLRTTKVNVTPQIKSEIADYKDFRKSIGSKLGTSKDGLSVDVAYQQLTEMYPEYFSDDIWNETDQFLRMAEVASMDLYRYDSQPLDDEIIQEAVNIILNEVRGYKESLTRTAAEETAREALDSIAPPISTQLANGSRGDALLNQSLENFPIKTVEDRLNEKIRAVSAELADNKQLRRESEYNYNNQISILSDEYATLKNHNTKKANDILRRVARLEQLKASVDANYAKRISDLEARVEKMNSEQYRRAMHKQDKMQEHAKWAENLLGDTSTWKDKKIGLQYAVNTERRNLRDIVRDENGNEDIAKADAINDALNGQYNREEAAKKRELAKVRGKYADLKITKAEDTYIQMLGEFRHNPDTTLTEKFVKEYYEAHKDKIDTAKVDKVIELARQDYDNLLKRVNEKLREQGMKEIPYRQGYFPHFTEPKQNFIQKLLNWKTQDNEIPTSIAGLTEDFKPVKSWQSFDKTRYSDETDFSFLKGFDNYSQGALDWVYHLDTLQKRRAVENHIRYTHSDEGIQARIKEVYANEGIDANEAQAQIENILSEAKNPLNNFVQDFTTHTNILAGKKNSLDRTVEQWTNRHIYSVMTNVQNRMSANMVLANVRSALTNFIPITQSWAQVSPMRSLQATKDTIANAIKDDGIIEKSTFLTNRLREVDNLYNTAWDKVLDKAGIMFEIVDNFSSQVIWRSKYNQNLADGMTESQAIKNADQFAENVMAGRSKGNEPTLFNAKNPFVKAFTMFQLEVNNQYGYLFKDVPNDLKSETNHWKLNLAKGYTTAFIGAYVYNELLTKLTGSDAALDPIGIIEDLLRDLGLLGDDDEEKEPVETAMNLIENVGGELPFVGGTVFGGGRIPMSSALPYGDDGFFGGIEAFAKDVSEGDFGNIGKELMNPILNVGLPVGGGQIKKTFKGLSMFNTDEEHPIAGSYTDKGGLRFPVEDTIANRVQAGVFGQWANENAREYIENGRKPLSPEKTQEFIDIDLPIADYWKYLDGLNALEPLEGKKTVTLNQKGDYIGSLDLPVEVKNILINNIADDRKTPIDFTGYENYSNFEEFDFATRYPEKYEVLKEQGISVADYKKNYEETAFMYTDDYSWAANNPEQYTVSKAVTDDVMQYKQYTSDLNNIKADKYSNGKSISGSRKEKVVDYINNLDLDYGAKLILFKSEYQSDDTYNAEIVEYLNNREDLTYEERVTIYKKLGFTVNGDYVYWD